MLIGKEFEKDTGMTATNMCANHLADHIRNTYLTNTNLGLEAWEEGFSEAPSVIPNLQSEGFTNLIGIDYLFQWWGESKTRDLAGEIIVVWKIKGADGREEYYRTWLKLAERDFVIGAAGSEAKKRQLFRAEFREAFETWKEFFAEG